MRPVLIASILAIGAAVPAAGQETRPVIKTEEGKQIVVDGCLTGGPSTFTLSNVAVTPPTHPRRDVPVGTAGTAISSYNLRGRDGVNLSQYVGKKVEVRGVLLTSRAATAPPTESAEKPKRDDSPDVKTHNDDKADPAVAALRPNVAVTEVRVLSAACR
jgi:hypothetical protein